MRFGSGPFGSGIVVQMSPRRRSAEPIARAEADASDRDGVISRDELKAFGVDRFGVRAQVNRGRWRRHGRQTVSTHTGELSERAQWWRAIYELGPNIAALDGVTALRAAGVKNLDADQIHVSLRHASRPLPVVGVRVHQVRSWDPKQVIDAGVPRVRPAIAALRSAHWAVSDRQAALFLCVVVQQRIVSADMLRRQLGVVHGRRRRAFIHRVVDDLLDGAQSLGELDFAAMCRARGLPEPTRQVVRSGPNGRIYLDVRWDGLGLVVEIDGAQHRQGLAVTEDNLRQNSVALTGDVVLRIDLIGLRIEAQRFMDQVDEAHRVLAGRLSA